MPSDLKCLRCSDVALTPLPHSDGGTAFYGCPRCDRQFALAPGKALVERWLGPLSIVLYGVIFESEPQTKAAGTVRVMSSQHNVAFLARLESEIRLELESPTQQVRDILDLKATEENLREYLTIVADGLAAEVRPYPVVRVLDGHTGPVRSIAIGAGTLVSGGADATARRWNLDTGAQERICTAPGGEVLAVAIDAGTETVAIGSADGTVHLWTAGGPVRPLHGHNGPVNAVAFSPDGRLLATGSADRTVRLWKVASGRSRGVLRAHSHRVLSVAFSPDGARVVSGSSGGTLAVWDRASGQLLRTLDAHAGEVRSVVFWPFGRESVVVSCGSDGTIERWDLDAPTGRADAPGMSRWEEEVQHRGAVRSVAVHPTRGVVLSGGADRTIAVRRTESGEELRSFTAHGGPVRAVAVSPDGHTLASCSQTIKLWRMP